MLYGNMYAMLTRASALSFITLPLPMAWVGHPSMHDYNGSISLSNQLIVSSSPLKKSLVLE